MLIIDPTLLLRVVTLQHTFLVCVSATETHTDLTYALSPLCF